MIAILDIGKTNKKCFVFDENYRIVFEKTTQLPETTDEDGDPCEDVDMLMEWVLATVWEVLSDGRFQIRAINCTAYGASWLHVSPNPVRRGIAEQGSAIRLYNYLKPFPEDLKKQFFDTYGGEAKIALETASPVLGNLNSGLQLYWLKHRKPLIFSQIKYSLHLPQYISYLIHSVLHESGGDSKSPPDDEPNQSRGDSKSPRDYARTPNQSGGDSESPPDYAVSEITSIGCHTMLWNFGKNDYHEWVKKEGLVEKFPPLVQSGGELKSPPDSVAYAEQGSAVPGYGLHDSSAALIPYLASFDEPFVLISTGTWCISLNPFNQEPLTTAELEKDCLCYMTYEGKPVKAARYFGGNEHEKCIKGLAQQFNKPLDYYKSISYDEGLIAGFREEKAAKGSGAYPFKDYETAYHFVVAKIFKDQYHSTKLVLTKATQRIFVDGGFSKNEIYMTLLAKAFPKLEVCAAEVAQATALGAAIAMHDCWNKKPLPKNLITLKKIRV